MSQTLNQRRNLKVIIGERYIDPTIDNPILRRMPTNWQFQTPDKPKRHWGDYAVRCVCVAIGAFIVAMWVVQIWRML